MPKIEAGLFKLDAWRRAPHGVGGPVRAKGKVTFMGLPWPAFVLALLLPEFGEKHLSFGFGVTNPKGIYRVDIATEALKLNFGSYRIREIVVPFFGFPLIQDVPVALVQDIAVAAFIGGVGTMGSIHNEVICANIGTRPHAFNVAAGLVPTWMPEFRPPGTVMEELDVWVTVSPTYPEMPEIPGVPTFQEIIERSGLPTRLELERYEARGAGEVRTPPRTPVLQQFDPFDEDHIRDMDEIRAIWGQTPGGLEGQFERHGRIAPIARRVDWMDLQVFDFDERASPFSEFPPAAYDGMNFLAENYDAATRTLWGFVSMIAWPLVWIKEPEITGAAIVSAIWRVLRPGEEQFP